MTTKPINSTSFLVYLLHCNILRSLIAVVVYLLHLLHQHIFISLLSFGLAMKTMRDQGVMGLDMAKCLMLLSCRLETKFKKCSSSPNDVFECKTCKRQFPSFQALGGHRASHKRERTLTGSDQDPKSETKLVQSKPKKHECSICGLEFSLGQALGGHMRRHRMMNAGFSSSYPVPSAAVAVASKIPVLMRSNSKRVMCMDMDLNLTPLENDLKVLFGNMAPKVDTLIS